MNFDLKRPCNNCPFRNDKSEQFGWLGEGRAFKIQESLLVDQQTFECHKTADLKKSQHCAGALIMLERMERPNQMMRIAERVGDYDKHSLDMSSPIVENGDEFIELHA